MGLRNEGGESRLIHVDVDQRYAAPVAKPGRGSATRGGCLQHPWEAAQFAFARVASMPLIWSEQGKGSSSASMGDVVDAETRGMSSRSGAARRQSHPVMRATAFMYLK